MKCLHTGDWHLGKRVHGIHMTEDQRHVLGQLIGQIQIEKPDVLLLAGDIFDRSVPPVEAVTLADWFFSELRKVSDCAVCMISGNHDSADRLGFARGLLKSSNFHIATTYQDALNPVVIECSGQKLQVFLLPFLEPAMVRYIADQPIETHDDVFAHFSKIWAANSIPGIPSVLVAHGFIGHDGQTSESERPLAIGGTEIVDARHVDQFDYVALGHLHRPQKVGRDQVRYAGSLLKYSFSEAPQVKSLTWVTIHPRETQELIQTTDENLAQIAHSTLTPLRDLRIIEGTLKELMEAPSTPVDDYLMARLTDTGALYEPMRHLRSVYPNILKMERVRIEGMAAPENQVAAQEAMSLPELFSAFYQHVQTEEVSEERLKTFIELVGTLPAKEA